MLSLKRKFKSLVDAIKAMLPQDDIEDFANDVLAQGNEILNDTPFAETSKYYVELSLFLEGIERIRRTASSRVFQTLIPQENDAAIDSIGRHLTAACEIVTRKKKMLHGQLRAVQHEFKRMAA